MVYTAEDDQAGLVTVITARCLTKPAPAAAMLIRPDGYVAWAAGTGAPNPAADMDKAMRTWFTRMPPALRARRAPGHWPRPIFRRRSDRARRQ